MANDGGMTTGSKGGFAPDGDPGVIAPIASGMPTGGNPGNGDLPFLPTGGGGEIPPVSGSGPIK